MKKTRASLVALTLAAGGLVVPASSASAEGIGGWIEEIGAVDYQPGPVTGGWVEEHGAVVHDQEPDLGVRPELSGARSAAQHTGSAETRVISGTTNKRAVGRTTWNRVYHYTTAQLERTWPSSGVIATSGRNWGVDSTSAVSPWRAYNPEADSDGYGIAKTYYGR